MILMKNILMKFNSLFIIILMSLVILLSASCHKDSDTVENNSNPLTDVRFWAYQLEGLEEPASIDSICSSHYDLIVMDQQRSISGSEDYDTRADIQRIHNSSNSKGNKKLVVCYLDAGQAESYRYYWQSGWQQGNPSWILDPDPDGWNNSYGVKFWSPEWKSVVKQYIEKIIDDGFDGVYLDWLMIYEDPSVIEAAQLEGRDAREELISFIRELTIYAREKKSGFLFIAQNGAELGAYPEYVNLFDAISQEDIWYDGNGDPDNGGSQGDWPVGAGDSHQYIDQLTKWQQQGKPVFNVEYAQMPDNVTRAYSLGSQHSYRTYTALRLLDKLSGTPPPGY
jgi:cysteinyl-tRNA synthetase, unknown class